MPVVTGGSPVYVKALAGHPYSKWVDGVRNEYNSALSTPPQMFPPAQSETISFSTSRLIDVFLYTQYAHQPDSRRQRQYEDCLKELGGNKTFLTWLFLSELWGCSLKIVTVGRMIASWLDKYCHVKQLTPNVLASLQADHKGIGTVEKKEAREKRLLDAKVEELAQELWKQKGCPEKGHTEFVLVAQRMISAEIDGGS